MIWEGFPERTDKTVRAEAQIGFMDENTMALSARYKGFGDLYPTTGAIIRKEVMI